MTPETILKTLIPEKDLNILENKSIAFKCTCSRERTESTLKLLGKAELLDMIKEQHGADVHCNFCNEHYAFSEKDLNNIILKLDQQQH